MSDILGKFSKNSAEGAAKAAPAQPTVNNPDQVELDRGTNLIDKAGAIKSDSAAAKASQTSADDKSASSKVEPSGTDVIVEEPDSWSKESALKEVKKLREENKLSRLKYQEQIEKLRAEQEARMQAQKSEVQELIDAKKELDRLKADQEDKKRDLSEKVAHREAKLAELQAIMEAKEREYQNRIVEMQGLLGQFEAERQAEAQVYQSRIQEELDRVPEKYRDYANLIVKGAGDPKDALLALNEAKLKGMFEDKTVVVNHSVPGAKDGARASKERLEENDREQRSRLDSKSKIKMALDQMKSGQTNSAFRMK